MIALDGNGREIARRTYSASAGSSWRCFYYPIVGIPGSNEIDIGTEPITPQPDQAIELICYDGNEKVYEQIFVFDPNLPFGLINAAADAALVAREMLPLPDPDIITSPPAGSAQLVGIATWYAVGTAWQTFSASATLGGVTATVTATPASVRWDPGDGAGPITCDGPGRTFDPANPTATSDCTHTYRRHTAPGTTLALTATVTYEVAWTATDGSGDTLDDVTRTTTVPITVDQAQALIR